MRVRGGGVSGGQPGGGQGSSVSRKHHARPPQPAPCHVPSTARLAPSVCPQIIHVNLTQHDNDTEPVLLEAGTAVEFTYAVTWTPTDTEFERRFEKYLDYGFFEHKARATDRRGARPLTHLCCGPRPLTPRLPLSQPPFSRPPLAHPPLPASLPVERAMGQSSLTLIPRPTPRSTGCPDLIVHWPTPNPHPPLPHPQIHWFSIFNSFMMVMFLTGLVTIILMRTLRRDYARYARVRGLHACGASWGCLEGGGRAHAHTP